MAGRKRSDEDGRGELRGGASEAAQAGSDDSSQQRAVGGRGYKFSDEDDEQAVDAALGMLLQAFSK